MIYILFLIFHGLLVSKYTIQCLVLFVFEKINREANAWDSEVVPLFFWMMYEGQTRTSVQLCVPDTSMKAKGGEGCPAPSSFPLETSSLTWS